MATTNPVQKQAETTDFRHGACPQALGLEPTGQVRLVRSYEWAATYPDGHKESVWSQPDSMDAKATYEAVRRQVVERIATWRDLLLTTEEWAHVAAYMRSQGDSGGAMALETALVSLPGGVGPLGTISWTQAVTIWQACHRLGIPL